MKRSTPILILLATGGFARADVAYDNFGPGSTFTGNGWLVRGPGFPPWWTHAFPITAGISGEITTITVAIHHLEGSTNNYLFELRSDAGGSPGPLVSNLGQVAGFAGGTVPVQFTAKAGINITAGTTYWVYARGEGDTNGTWLTSPTLGGVRAYSLNGGSSFTVAALAATNAQGAIRIEVAPATTACYPNCDASTGTPLLTGNDFACFITAFAAGASYANCDGSTGTPALTGNDFACFITAYAAGCR